MMINNMNSLNSEDETVDHDGWHINHTSLFRFLSKFMAQYNGFLTLAEDGQRDAGRFCRWTTLTGM
ncbi:MAG: hypothetical protein GXY64_06915 [Bacteroidales bacterium]|nr:hypothetical protein [Bacteroidales bacterium]